MMSRFTVTCAFVLMVNGALAQTINPRLPDPVLATDFPVPEIDLVVLGWDLFFDPILSGNRNIACATCHHPSLGTSDGMSLSIGEGGFGLGPARLPVAGNEPKERIPRNAPALYNLGAFEFTTMFHDGRVEMDAGAPFGIKMPDGFALERALPSALAAQTILPILSADEMAGHGAENPISMAVTAKHFRGPDGAWQQLADRVWAIPNYRQRFTKLNGQDTPLHITDIGRALAAFIAYEYRATDSAFDQFQSGDDQALDQLQKRGLSLFYGKANCASCHAGPFQTDHSFHAIGMPQIGPGKSHSDIPPVDLGRGALAAHTEDSYRFRTPSLRNIALTAPYGHDGAFPTLDAVLRHHLDPFKSLGNYEKSQAILHDVVGAKDWAILKSPEDMIEIAAGIEIEMVELSESEINALIAFLQALSDVENAQGRLKVPSSVPSNLPLDPVGIPPSPQ